MANVLNIVTYNIFPPVMGGQKCIASFNEYFSKEHKLYCFTVKNNDPSFASYPLFNEWSNSRWRYINIFYYKAIKKIIRENQISHVIIEHPYYGWMGLLLRKLCGVTLIIQSHNIESERFRSVGKCWWKILWHYEKWIHSKADHTFAITEEDRQYFIKHYQMDPSKADVITYGFPLQNIPSVQERMEARETLLKKYSLPGNTILFLFNGALDYGPNSNAVKNIVEKINPLFIQKNIPYRIIICGNRLPPEMNELKEYLDKNIIYAGFVDDITLYCKGCNVFINPVLSGGGIKTKLVEALGYNLNAVSSVTGAYGVDHQICNRKLAICQNEDWESFAGKMQQLALYENSTPPEFFEHFYWGNITQKAAGIINSL